MKQAIVFAYGSSLKQVKHNVDLIKHELKNHNAEEYFQHTFTNQLTKNDFLLKINDLIDDSVNCIFITDYEQMFIDKNVIEEIVLELQKIGIDLIDQFEGNLTEKFTSVIKKNVDDWKHERSLETKQKRTENTKMGKWTGGKTPFGYRLTVFKKLLIKEDEAKVIKEMFQQYSEGCSMNTVTRIIGDKYGLKYIDGYWRTRKIYDILVNPIYKGYYSYNKNTVIDGKMISLPKDKWVLSDTKDEDIVIVDELLFERVQGMLEKDTDKPAYHTKQCI